MADVVLDPSRRKEEVVKKLQEEIARKRLLKQIEAARDQRRR
jgi:hypothetical protein